MMADNSTLNMSYNFDFSNMSAVNVTSYPRIQNFTNFSSWNAPFVPINEVWVLAWGGWFYVLLTIVLSGAVFVKFRQIFPAAFILLLLSAVAVTAMPLEVQAALYLLMVLGFIGALYGIFERRR